MSYLTARAEAWVLSFALLIAHCSLLNAARLDSGAAYLKLDPSAAPASLAGAYTAVNKGIDTLAYNPGGLAGIDQREAAFTHTEWLMGTKYEYLAYAEPTRFGTFALSALRLGYGDLQGHDASRLATGSFSAYDSAYTLGYAHQVGGGVGLGGTFKLLERKIASDHASSYAMDLGGVGQVPGQPVYVGASILNIGPGMRFIDQTDPLPLTFAVGASYVKDRTLRVNLDVKHQANDKVTTVMSGLQYSPVRMLALRGGYQVPLNATGDQSAWDMNNLRAGIGLQVQGLRLDYALAPMGDAGIGHQFTLGWTFGPKLEPAKPPVMKSSDDQSFLWELESLTQLVQASR